MCYPWATVHTDDVLCMDKYQHLFLGTSSYNGDILLWNISLHKPVFNFNASESYKPLQLQKVSQAPTSQLWAGNRGRQGVLGATLGSEWRRREEG